MNDLEFLSMVHRAAVLAEGTAPTLKEQHEFHRLRIEVDDRIQETMRAGWPAQPPIIYDIKRGVVSDQAGALHALPKPELKGWWVIDLILWLGADMNFPGCAALLVGDNAKRPDNALRNLRDRVAEEIEPINRFLATSIRRDIEIATNGSIRVNYRRLHPIQFDA